MHANENVAVRVHLEQVPVQRVEPEATHREGRIVLELEDLDRVAERDEPLLDQVETELLVLGRFVLGDRVVHVEAIVLDVLEVERTIHEDSGKGKRERYEKVLDKTNYFRRKMFFLRISPEG